MNSHYFYPYLTRFFFFCFFFLFLFICLQETFLKTDDIIDVRGFNAYNYIHSEGHRPSGGSSIFVKSYLHQREIKMKT